MRNDRVPALLAATASLALAAGCAEDGNASASAARTEMEVVASFYPLQWVTERLVGDRVAVSGLTAPGAEPHDLELTPQDVAEVGEADLLVYLSGFQPAVDAAVESAGAEADFDVSDAAALDLTYGGDGDEHADEEGDEHAEGEQVTDPHFWLDPLRLADVGDAIADQLAEVDPDGAEAYAQNAADVRADLEELDGEFSEGLAQCESTTLVTSHEAFGYLAEGYGFTQLGVSGLSPEDEPNPAELAEVTDFVETNDVGTIYFETLVSPDIAQTVADETGAETATLDPLEGLTDESAGDDYLEVMRSNLGVLQQGQDCA
jgi:zinc transport system substrate-binding protein